MKPDLDDLRQQMTWETEAYLNWHFENSASACPDNSGRGGLDPTRKASATTTAESEPRLAIDANKRRAAFGLSNNRLPGKCFACGTVSRTSWCRSRPSNRRFPPSRIGRRTTRRTRRRESGPTKIDGSGPSEG